MHYMNQVISFDIVSLDFLVSVWFSSLLTQTNRGLSSICRFTNQNLITSFTPEDKCVTMQFLSCGDRLIVHQLWVTQQLLMASRQLTNWNSGLYDCCDDTKFCKNQSQEISTFVIVKKYEFFFTFVLICISLCRD